MEPQEMCCCDTACRTLRPKMMGFFVRKYVLVPYSILYCTPLLWEYRALLSEYREGGVTWRGGAPRHVLLWHCQNITGGSTASYTPPLSLYSDKRALYSDKRALYSDKRALYSDQRALYAVSYEHTYPDQRALNSDQIALNSDQIAL